MSDREIRAEIEGLEIQSLIQTQRELGRAKLPQDFLVRWALVHQKAIAILDDPPRGQDVRQLAQLLAAVTRSVANLADGSMPRYYTYSDVHILDWFLGSQRAPFRELRARAVTGICVLLQDLVKFEGASLAGMETCYAERLDPEDIKKRIAVVKGAVREVTRLLGSLGGSVDPDIYDTRHYDTISGYVTEESRASALVHLTCFPQTQFHDEVLFLRTIHISELCFFGLRLSYVEAVENPLNDRVQAQALQDALGFAAVLHKVFLILRTMPPEHFKDFRAATGRASAIQSRNYQLMDIHFRGMDSRKRAQLEADPLLRDLPGFLHPQFVHLAQAVKDPSMTSDAVRTIAKKLDRELLGWRGLHLMFAQTYLDPAQPGTGATEGAPYLDQFLRSGLFVDTELDVVSIAEVFKGLPEISEMLKKISSRIGIAPQLKV